MGWRVAGAARVAKVGRKVVMVALAATETTVVSEVIVVVTVANETE